MKKRFLQMKTAMRAVMLILMMGVVGITEGFAYDFWAECETGQKLYYNIADSVNHYVTVVSPTLFGYHNLNGKMTIPDVVTNVNDSISYQVTSIGDNAFNGCIGLTSVEIPNSVTSIGDNAFYQCTGLNSLTIGNSVTSIGEFAFAGCAGLTSLTIPNTVKSIGDLAFSQCAGLTSLTIGNSVKSIGNSAFSECTGLTSLTIGSSVESIGEYAFSGCAGLTSLTIPNSVERIGDGAFNACTGLTSVYYTGNIAQWCNITFGEPFSIVGASSNPLYYAHNLYINNVLVTDLIIPNTVTEIKKYAFSGCTGLTSVEIPNSVTSIGDNAFSGCTGLTSVEIPNSVISIGDNAFSGCTGLTTINWNAVNVISYPYYSNNPFNNCTNLSTVVFGEDVETIPSNAFYLCSSLSSITIPNSVTSIGDNAFSGCIGLTSVEIPNSVTDTSIGNSAFSGCTGLKSLTIGNSVTSIGVHAFYGCKSVKSLTIPNSVTSIGDGAFGECEGLTSLTIPYSVTSIGNSAFYGCAGLTSLTIPYSVTSIGNSAFSGCTGLTSLTIPNSVTSIGDYAFRGCTGLTSLTIGNSFTSIGDHAFEDCSNIKSMTVLTKTPQTIYSSTFSNVNKDIPVYVHDVSSYRGELYWKDFKNYKEMEMADVLITGYGSSDYSDHWVFVASPLASSVQPTVVDGLFADPYDLYRFNQLGNITDGEWENYKNQENTEDFVLENGKGYLYANKNNVTLTFAGTMNMNASHTVALAYDDRANLPGWNLIGNPFTEAAYIDRPYYKMNATGTDVTPVENYGTTPVAAYSGIMVHAETSGESVTFTKSGPKSSDNGGLQITLSKAGVRGDEAQDKVIVSFNKYAQLSKFIFNEDNAKLYIPMGGEDYAIAYSDRQSNMPLYFKTKEMGIYTMSFEGAIDNIKIIDNLDGSVIDLNAERSFTFVGTPSDRNDRFTIVFNTPATEDFAYQSGDGIVVNGEGELQVFDIMGRMVAKYHVNGEETVNIPCQSGVYVLRLLGKETKTQKIVVK